MQGSFRRSGSAFESKEAPVAGSVDGSVMRCPVRQEIIRSDGGKIYRGDAGHGFGDSPLDSGVRSRMHTAVVDRKPRCDAALRLGGEGRLVCPKSRTPGKPVVYFAYFAGVDQAYVTRRS